MLYAISRAIVYVVTSLGLVYLVDYFGSFGVWIIALPISLGFLWGVEHFTRLEQRESQQEEYQFTESNSQMMALVKV
jgi:hypothetical protein